MASDIRVNELKQEILRLLKEDEEFRYAIAGLIGLNTIISELKSLKEAILDNSRDIRELQKAVIEHSRAIKELQEVVVEHGKAIKALQETIIEHSNAIMELQKAVIEHSRAIKELQGEMVGLRASIYAVGNRYGVVTEEAFRSAISYLVEDLLKEYKVERWVYYDSRGAVYGTSSTIEIDVLVRDKEHILIEYKAHVDKGDIGELERIAKLYEEAVGVKAKKVIVGASVTERAVELARTLGIEVRAGNIYRKEG